MYTCICKCMYVYLFTYEYVYRHTQPLEYIDKFTYICIPIDMIRANERRRESRQRHSTMFS